MDADKRKEIPGGVLGPVERLGHSAAHQGMVTLTLCPSH